MWRFMDVNFQIANFLFLFWTWVKSLSFTTPGDVAYIWQTEQIQIDAIEFEGM